MRLEQPVIEVLRYLHTDVFDIVDHNNPKETSTFRSLLAHSSSPSVVISATDANPNTGGRNRPSSSGNVAFIEREFDGNSHSPAVVFQLVERSLSSQEQPDVGSKVNGPARHPHRVSLHVHVLNCYVP